MRIHGLKPVYGMAAFILLFAAPLFIHLSLSWKSGAPVQVGWPHIHGGDEPHYLLVVASLVRDGDLDLANNYRAARSGSADAGEPFRSVTIDHHTKFVDDRNQRLWKADEIYAMSWPECKALPPDAPLPRKPDTQSLKLETMREYMFGQAAFPLVMAAFLWPYRWLSAGTGFDVAAILVVWFISLAGLYLFFRLASYLKVARPLVLTSLLAFGTPIWNYSLTLFPETIFWVILIGALYSVVIGKHLWLAGILMGFAILVKPGFILFGIILGMAAIRFWGWRAVALYVGPFLGIGLLQLAYNHWLYGNAAAFSQGEFSIPSSWPGDMAIQFGRVLLEPAHGLIVFAPILILACLPMGRGSAPIRVEPWLWLMIIGWLVAVILPYAPRSPGGCYGPRYLLPIVPLLVLLTARWFSSDITGWRKSVAAFLLVVSMAINAQGAFLNSGASGRSPLFALETVLGRR